MSKQNKPVKLTQEEKQQKYKDIVEKRAYNIIRFARMIARTTANKYYPVGDEEITVLVTRLHEEVDSISNAFNSRSKTTKKEEIGRIF